MLPVAAIVDSIARLHKAQSFLLYAQQHATPPGPARTLLGVLVALIVYGPLGFACWELGREHTTARRMGVVWLVGLGEVVRRAFDRNRTEADDVSAHEAASRAPRDTRWAALAWAAPIAIIVPAFFEYNVPWLRTPLASAWVIGAGILMGATVYFRRRAIAYLLDEPSPWAMVSQNRFLDASRYAEPGRVFIRLQKVSVFMLAAWWLGVGALVLMRSTPAPH